jgi:hypothetical protein
MGKHVASLTQWRDSYRYVRHRALSRMIHRGRRISSTNITVSLIAVETIWSSCRNGDVIRDE